MAANDPNGDLHEYAGGWMTERKGTDVSSFLKLSYIVVAAGAIGYAWLYMNGEVNNESRGALVRQFVAETSTANAFMYFVIALAVVFAIVLWRFAFTQPHED